MLRLFRGAFWLCLALSLALGANAAGAADRKSTLLPATDLPGFDY